MLKYKFFSSILPFSLFYLSFLSMFFPAYGVESPKFVRGLDLDPKEVFALSIMAKKSYDLSIPPEGLGSDDFSGKKWNYEVLKKTVVRKNGTSSEEIEGAVYSNAKFGTVVAIRGTKYKRDWGTNLDFSLVDFEEDDCTVHNGFLRMLKEIENDLKLKLQNALQNDFLKKPVYFVGHSRGGALATLAAAMAYPIVADVQPNQVKVVTFSAPRVGGRKFVDMLHTRIGKGNILAFYCNSDFVPCTPLSTFGYCSHGINIEINWGQQTWGKSIKSFFGFLKTIEKCEEDDPIFDVKFDLTKIMSYAKGELSTTSILKEVSPKLIEYFIRTSHEIPSESAIEWALNVFNEDYDLGLPSEECGRSSAIFSFKTNPWLIWSQKVLIE